jgi:hypothetical protein
VPEPTEVDDAAFRAVVEPYAMMVAEVSEAGYAATHAVSRESLQDPSPASSAMAELAGQDQYAGVWDPTLVDTAHTHISLLLTAGEDAMRTYATAILADRTPLYAYIPLARSGLECLALAHWLGAPDIGLRERVRRSLNERIASAYEQSRLPAGLNPEPDRQRRLLEAAALGYPLTPSRRRGFRHLAPERPTITAHVRRVLGGDDDLGRIVYSYTSAISHGTLWGLAERADVPDDQPGPVVRAPLAISSSNIGLMAAALVMAHVQAYGGFVSHMGWDEPGWRAAVERAWVTIGNLVGWRAPIAPQQPEPSWQLETPGGLWLPEPA